jgi:hypothetical protein
MSKQIKPKIYNEDDLKLAFEAGRKSGPYTPTVNYFYSSFYEFLDWLKSGATKK